MIEDYINNLEFAIYEAIPKNNLYYHHKPRDILVGMAKAGKSLAVTSSLADNPWVNHVNQRYDMITNPLRMADVSAELKKLKSIRKKYN